MQSGKTLRHYPDMPLPQQNWGDLVPNPLLQEQLAFDQEEMSNRVNQNCPHFNPEQKLASSGNASSSVVSLQGMLAPVVPVALCQALVALCCAP